MSAVAATPGRVVLITGGTSGIGAALVDAFLAAGDRVYTFGRRPERVARLLAERPAVAENLVTLPGDVTDDGFRAALVARIGSECDRLDCLINNAGTLRSTGFLEEGLDDWRATLETNLVAPYAWIRDCAPLLGRSQGPNVINISSACARHPFASCTSTSYSVSKAGLDLLTERLALGLGPRGIRVNAIAPGVVPSEMWGPESALIETTARGRHVLGGSPIAPAQIAQAALFLASDAARSITGAILKVDAGYTLG